MNDLQPENVRSAAVTLDRVREELDDSQDEQVIDRTIQILDDQLEEELC